MKCCESTLSNRASWWCRCRRPINITWTPSLSLKLPVWKYFGFPVSYVDNVRLSTKKSVCKLCYARVPYSSTDSMTNMAGHLRRHHKNIDLSFKRTPATQTTLQSSFRIKLPSNSTRANAITSALVFIAADMQPYSVVENSGFRHLISILEPRYKIPIRTHLTATVIPSMYNDVKEKVIEGLSSAFSGLNYRLLDFQSNTELHATAHFTNDDWEIKNPVLQTRPIYEAHTSEHLAEVLREVVVEWKLDGQNATIPVTTDNAKNIVNASHAAGLSPHIGCFAHTVNLASQKGLGVNQISRLLGRSLSQEGGHFFPQKHHCSSCLKVKTRHASASSSQAGSRCRY